MRTFDFCSPVPLDGRLRPSVRHARPDRPCRADAQLAALQHREGGRRPVPDHHGGGWLLPDEIELTQHENTLLVTGNRHPDPEGTQFLHRGIATRAFKQTFNLADHVRVKDASLENGLLTVDLVREVPEELKPRRIAIANGGQQQALGQDNAKQIEHEPAKGKAA